MLVRIKLLYMLKHKKKPPQLKKPRERESKKD